MTDQEPQRKKGGRPRKHSPDAKRPTMAFRMSSHLHERLIASADANERSLSEEIERRLDNSFNDYDNFIKLLGGQNNSKLLITIASAWSVVELLSDKKWTESQDVLDAMKIAAADVLAMVKPPHDQDKYREDINSDLSDLGDKHYKRITINDFGLGAAAYAVSIAKQIEVSDKIKDLLLDSAHEFRARRSSVASGEA